MEINLGPQQGDDLLQMETNEFEMVDPAGVMGPQLNPPPSPPVVLERVSVDSEKKTSEISPVSTKSLMHPMEL